MLPASIAFLSVSLQRWVPGQGSTECFHCHRDALLHVCRVHRILSQPRGNALLVGVGGSGRKSLARLAAYIGELKVFSIEITNTYRLQEFREDLKGLYRQAGVAGKPTMFLFDESQVGTRLTPHVLWFVPAQPCASCVMLSSRHSSCCRWFASCRTACY